MPDVKIVRKVVGTLADGTPRLVRDRRLNIDVQMVRSARTRHPCSGPLCDFVQPGEPYLVVKYRDRLRRMNKVLIPERENFHAECLPQELVPTLRFFK